MANDPQENGDVPADDELAHEMLGDVSGGGNGGDDDAIGGGLATW